MLGACIPSHSKPRVGFLFNCLIRSKISIYSYAPEQSQSICCQAAKTGDPTITNEDAGALCSNKGEEVALFLESWSPKTD